MRAAAGSMIVAGLMLAAAAGCRERGVHVERVADAGAGFDDSKNELVRVLRRGKDADERARAAWALGSLGDAEYVPVLREALADENAFVRTMAAEGLGRRADPEVVPDLIICLKDPSPHVRRAVVSALQRIDTEPAREAVAEYFRRNPVGGPQKR